MENIKDNHKGILIVSDNQSIQEQFVKIANDLKKPYSVLHHQDVSKYNGNWWNASVLVVEGNASQVFDSSRAIAVPSIIAIVPDDELSDILTQKIDDLFGVLSVNDGIERASLMVSVAFKTVDRIRSCDSATYIMQSLMEDFETFLVTEGQFRENLIQQNKQSQLRGEVLSAIRPALMEATSVMEKTMSNSFDHMIKSINGLHDLEGQLEWLEGEAEELQKPIGTNHD